MAKTMSNVILLLCFGYYSIFFMFYKLYIRSKTLFCRLLFHFESIIEKYIESKTYQTHARDSNCENRSNIDFDCLIFDFVCFFAHFYNVFVFNSVWSMRSLLLLFIFVQSFSIYLFFVHRKCSFSWYRMIFVQSPFSNIVFFLHLRR